MVTSLKKDFDLSDEVDANDFLGVKITNSDDRSIMMNQPALIERILKDMS